MLSKKMATALSAQATAEYASAYLYLAMSAWLKDAGYPGAAAWMDKHADEENFHARKFFDFLLDRGSMVTLGAISAPAAKWKTPLAVFEAAYAHEQKVTALITNLMALAKEEADYATEIFLQYFVTEQVEEEATFQDIVQKYQFVKDSPAGLFQIDQLLGGRKDVELSSAD